MPRIINESGLALIKQFEGMRLEAYPDVCGVWTIGYGHTNGVAPGMTITQDQADQLLLNDLDDAQNAVGAAVGEVDTSDNQFAAMVSLCYNIGVGNFRSSTVLKQHLVGDTPGAANAFLLWNKATIDGTPQVVTGLTLRRHAERALYLS